MSEPKKRKLRRLKGLIASEFQHESDVQATETLRKIPGLDRAVAKIMELGFERMFYLDNIASNVRVTPAMFGRLHRALTWACQILDIEEPEMYVTVDPVPNAWTYGHTKPFVVMTTGLIDMLDEEERLFVIGHELGHIKAGHVLYTLIARNIAAIVELIGQATFGIGALLGQGLAYALLEWYRKAELTGDRAGLLVVQDLEPGIRTFMKLSGGARSMYEDMNREEFFRQIRDYEDADRSDLNRAYKILLTVDRTHPYSILRAKELDAWFGAGYRDLMQRRGVEVEEAKS
jgi:Zn-dependent protease with chaperone function